MTIHHLNCATMCPAASRLPVVGSRLLPPSLVAHCLLIEGDDGLVLVDTGFGLSDVSEKGSRLGRPFAALVGARFDAAETAVRQVEALGFSATDVRDIVVTHLDLDHAGGLADFPHARVHVHTAELHAAQHPNLRERARYIPAQWAHDPKWVTHEASGDDWFGFASVQAVGDGILMIPLHGHTRGHCGVAVRRPEGGWLLHAGDAYFGAGEREMPPSCPPGLRVFQQLAVVDNAQRRANQQRLRELHAAHGDEVTVFCAHDASELAALARAGVTA